MININFGNLFTVELLHKFYTDQLCPDFSITTSAKTQQVLAGHKAIARQHNSRLNAGAQSDGVSVPLKPFANIESGMQTTFFMNLVNPLFTNYTNLPTASGSGKIYYFTNRNNNISNGKTFLSSKILAYNAATSYKPGDLILQGTGVVSTAIRSSDPAHLFAPTDTDHWTAVDNNRYVSGADVLQWMPTISTYQFGSARPSAIIVVLGYNAPTNNYTKSILSKTITFTKPLSAFTLDLSALDPGKYSLKVNGVQQWIYVNDELSGGATFAVIDIFNDATPVSCQLVDATQVLKSPVYSIYFLNRATIWKYILASGGSGTIVDTANVAHFSSPSSTVTSLKPIPLSDKALNLTLTLNHNNYTPIACADPQRLTSIAQSGDTYPCSEIFLNY